MVLLTLGSETGFGLERFETPGGLKGAEDIVGEFGEQPEGRQLNRSGFVSHRDAGGGALFRPALVNCNL